MKEKGEKGKIIRFPKLEDRLLRLGMEALEQKQFQLALDYFQQLRVLLPNDRNIKLSMVLCYLELGQLLEARELCEYLLYEERWSDSALYEAYFMVLLQFREYRQIMTLLVPLLDGKTLTPFYRDSFQKIYDFCELMDVYEDEVLHSPYTEDEVVAELMDGTVEQQMAFVNQLKDVPIKLFVRAFEQYLVDDTKHPLLKTFILQQMMAQEVNEQVRVRKFEQTMTLNIHNFNESPFYQMVDMLVAQIGHLEDENPTLFHLCHELILRHCFVLFPFSIRQHSTKLLWAAAFHHVAAQMQGIEVPLVQLERYYGVLTPDFYEAVQFILDVEQYSTINP